MFFIVASFVSALDFHLEHGLVFEDAKNVVHDVKNNFGSTLTKGTVVYISGSVGGLPTVAPVNVSDSDKYNVAGIVRDDISNGGVGTIVSKGSIIEMDTSAWSDGDRLYLSSSVGELSNTPTILPNHANVLVGTVSYSHAVHGHIQIISPQSFFFGNNHNSILRMGIQNKNNGDSAMSVIQTLNDNSHRASFGIVGSGHTVSEPESVFLYNEGYGTFNFINDGDVGFTWYNDPSDSHDYSVFDYEPLMNLTSSGNLDLNRGGNISANTLYANEINLASEIKMYYVTGACDLSLNHSICMNSTGTYIVG